MSKSVAAHFSTVAVECSTLTAFGTLEIVNHHIVIALEGYVLWLRSNVLARANRWAAMSWRLQMGSSCFKKAEVYVFFRKLNFSFAEIVLGHFPTCPAEEIRSLRAACALSSPTHCRVVRVVGCVDGAPCADGRVQFWKI